MISKPFSQACDNNRGPILRVLQQHLKDPGTLLELGSGTGQHAAWMPHFLPHIHWQPSDLPERLPGIRAWLADNRPANVADPLVLDMAQPWPSLACNYLLTVNTFHILAQDDVARAIQHAGERLPAGGLFVVYGPFNYDGRFTSESNARFNDWLRQQHPASAIRDIEWVCAAMNAAGMTLEADQAMPANNRTLVFRRTAEE